MRDDNYPTPVSDPEAEGLPETADDDSTAWDDVETGREADGADPAALPADHPLAVDRFGTTPEEARQGESLEYKLAQERPDVLARPAPDPSVGEDAPLVNDALDAPPPAAGLGDEVVTPDDSAVSMYDRPGILAGTGTVGRIVEPDEGAHPDTEKDAIARDAGAAGGGATAEELAMHEVVER